MKIFETESRNKILVKVVAPTPKALAATVARDPRASHSLKLENAALIKSILITNKP